MFWVPFHLNVNVDIAERACGRYVEGRLIRHDANILFE